MSNNIRGHQDPRKHRCKERKKQKCVWSVTWTMNQACTRDLMTCFLPGFNLCCWPGAKCQESVILHEDWGTVLRTRVCCFISFRRSNHEGPWPVRPAPAAQHRWRRRSGRGCQVWLSPIHSHGVFQVASSYENKVSVCPALCCLSCSVLCLSCSAFVPLRVVFVLLCVAFVPLCVVFVLLCVCPASCCVCPALCCVCPTMCCVCPTVLRLSCSVLCLSHSMLCLSCSMLCLPHSALWVSCSRLCLSCSVLWVFHSTLCLSHSALWVSCSAFVCPALHCVCPALCCVRPVLCCVRPAPCFEIGWCVWVSLTTTTTTKKRKNVKAFIFHSTFTAHWAALLDMVTGDRIMHAIYFITSQVRMQLPEW